MASREIGRPRLSTEMLRQPKGSLPADRPTWADRKFPKIFFTARFEPVFDGRGYARLSRKDVLQ
jgi:hypothetical protein